MERIADAAIHTLAYFDLFDYAPTLLDMHRWLLGTNDGPRTAGTSTPQPSVADIARALAQDQRVQNVDGFYVLAGREHLAELRKRKYAWTEEKWKRTQRYIRLIASMPYVEGIGLVNSMAWSNARATSDIDLLIVTTPGHIWSARFWTTALMKLLRKRPHENAHHALCLSLYVAADRLNLQPYRLNNADIHYTFWVNQCYPIFGGGNGDDHGTEWYADYIAQNAWVNDTFARTHWYGGSQRRAVTLSAPRKIAKRLLRGLCNERLLKMLQWRMMPKALRTAAANGDQDRRVVINDHILKLHTNDTRVERQHAWQQRVRQLEQL